MDGSNIFWSYPWRFRAYAIRGELVSFSEGMAGPSPVLAGVLSGASEMSSDTPRTDECYENHARMICSGVRVVPDYFARQLERELNAAKQNEGELFAECHSKMQEINQLKQQLVEARECLREACTGAGSLITPDATLARWRKAAGIEDEK
jgi:hypothetical protein